MQRRHPAQLCVGGAQPSPPQLWGPSASSRAGSPQGAKPVTTGKPRFYGERSYSLQAVGRRARSASSCAKAPLRLLHGCGSSHSPSAVGSEADRSPSCRGPDRAGVCLWSPYGRCQFML